MTRQHRSAWIVCWKDLVQPETDLAKKRHIGIQIIGRQADLGEVDRVEAWVQEAAATGAQIVTGGSRISDRVFAPTLIVDPPVDAKVSQLEIFGPVVCVYGYTDVADAIEQANDVPFSFQAAVFSQNIDEALHIANHLNGSAIMINEHTAFRDDVMPFAGLKQSGLGVGGIPYTIEDMQIQKMLVVKSPHLT